MSDQETPEGSVTAETLLRITDEATADIVGLANELATRERAYAKYPRVIFRLAAQDGHLSEEDVDVIFAAVKTDGVIYEASPYDALLTFPFHGYVMVADTVDFLKAIGFPVTSVVVQLAPDTHVHSIRVDALIASSIKLRVELTPSAVSETCGADLGDFLEAAGTPADLNPDTQGND